tara:strand:- start:20314 stop:20811 length:498 start_codon:yes stop_codon:yes gene_type:complete
MNLKRIIREEINDFDWVNGEKPLHPLLFELQDHDKEYKIWFGSIDEKEQERIKGVLFDLDLLPLNNVKKKVWLPHEGFDSLYFNYYDRHMGWGNEIDKWNVSHMGCSKNYGAPPHIDMETLELDLEKFGASWRCREDGASYGEGLKYNKKYFDGSSRIELPNSLI